MSDPKNKWTRPQTPPGPMFFGDKERNLVKQVNDELAERVLGQTIAYYPISVEDSNYSDIYGEAKEKVSLPPVRVFAYVQVDNDQTNTKFGYEYQTKLTVNFHRRRLVEDQNLFVRVGDFVQYGDVFYEIVKTYNDTRYYFGQVEHKFQISAECVKARNGAFRVTPSIDRPTLRQLEETDVSNPAPRPVPFPPLEATYLTVNSETKLPNERRLAAGTGIILTDGGPNSTLTIAASSPGAAGIAGAIQLQDGAGVSEGSSNLIFLTGSNRLGINTDDPTHSLTVVGNMSASSDVFFGGDVRIHGTLFGGSPLKIAGALEIHDTANGNGVIATMGDIDGSGDNSISASCLQSTDITSSVGLFSSITSTSLISASLYYGDGRYLTNLTASAVEVADGPEFSLQFRYDSPIGREISGSSNLTFITSSNTLSVTGDVSASANISASYYYGDGSNLTGIASTSKGVEGSLQFKTGSAEMTGSSAVVYDLANNNLTVNAGLVHSRVSVSTSYTASTSNYIIAVAAVPTNILFDADNFSAGQTLVIKDESGQSSQTTSIILNPAEGQTIDGAPALYVESPYGSVFIYTDGSNWFIY